MNNNIDRLFDIHDEYLPLAQWLQLILANAPHENDDQFTDASHFRFYHQIPDFAQALLTNPTREDVLRFGPLIFHLIACPTCHAAYLEIYDAMNATVDMKDERTTIGQLPQTVPNSLTRALVYTCQLLIHQAADVLHEAHREHKEQDAWARSLLRQAIYLSAQITQSAQRQRALQALIDAATLFDHEDESIPASQSYIPVLSTTSASRQSTLRRLIDTPSRQEGLVAIHLQTKSAKLDAAITQNNHVLELHLEDLDQDLRGRFLHISVPFGSLLEPVRWVGGNPLSIKSAVPVSEDGSLTTPLGRTDLQLSNQEEYNLLEAMFTILDVRPAD